MSHTTTFLSLSKLVSFLLFQYSIFFLTYHLFTFGLYPSLTYVVPNFPFPFSIYVTPSDTPLVSTIKFVTICSQATPTKKSPIKTSPFEKVGVSSTIMSNSAILKFSWCYCSVRNSYSTPLGLTLFVNTLSSIST